MSAANEAHAQPQPLIEPPGVIFIKATASLPSDVDAAALHAELQASDFRVGPLFDQPPDDLNTTVELDLGHESLNALEWNVDALARAGERWFIVPLSDADRRMSRAMVDGLTYNRGPVGLDPVMVMVSDQSSIHSFTVTRPLHDALQAERYAGWLESGEHGFEEIRPDPDTGLVVYTRSRPRNVDNMVIEQFYLYDTAPAGDDHPPKAPRIQLLRFHTLGPDGGSEVRIDYHLGFFLAEPDAVDRLFTPRLLATGDAILYDGRSKGDAPHGSNTQVPLGNRVVPAWELPAIAANYPAQPVTPPPAQARSVAPAPPTDPEDMPSAFRAGQNVRTLSDGSATRYATIALIAFGVLAIGAGIFIKLRAG
ncbi:MAG: hypothetical protein AAF823_15830 [Planctomycetota bacterium]